MRLSDAKRMVDNLINKVRSLKTDLEFGVESTMMEASLEMTHDVRKRLTTTGANAYKKNSDYRDEKWIRKRKKAGLQTGFKDLYFTGNMLESYLPRTPEKKQVGVISITASVADSEKRKVEMLSKQEGLGDNKAVTDPTDKELKKAQAKVDKYINELLRKYKI